MLDKNRMLMLKDISESITVPIKQIFVDIYSDYDSNVKMIFAYFHQELNSSFADINDRATKTKHYWADPSRNLIRVIEEIDNIYTSLLNTKLSFIIEPTYMDHIKYCKKFLSGSGGSTVPDDYEKISIINYDPIFKMNNEIVIKPKMENYKYELKLIGEGSYANVFKFIDAYYKITFAKKKLKADTDEKELERFKKEFQLLSEINHPNILKAYSYIEEDNSYIMEYCDFTLKDYYKLHNDNVDKLPFIQRKKIALQFLRALSFLHNKGYLHRDLGFKNVLLKEYDNDLLIVKVADFGLIKDKHSDLTASDSVVKGTIIDDTLLNFKDYNLKNEIYAVGVMLFYIFTAKERLALDDSILSGIVSKCVVREHDQRYSNIEEIISEINKLKGLNEQQIEEVESFNPIKTYITHKTYSMDKHELNDLALEMLENAIEQGYIIKIKSLSGLSVQSGKKVYSGTPRDEANIEHALELLVTNDYIKATNYKNELFNVTKKGYDLFEVVNS